MKSQCLQQVFFSNLERRWPNLAVMTAVPKHTTLIGFAPSPQMLANPRLFQGIALSLVAHPPSTTALPPNTKRMLRWLSLLHRLRTTTLAYMRKSRRTRRLSWRSKWKATPTKAVLLNLQSLLSQIRSMETPIWVVRETWTRKWLKPKMWGASQWQPKQELPKTHQGSRRSNKSSSFSWDGSLTRRVMKLLNKLTICSKSARSSSWAMTISLKRPWSRWKTR